MGGRGPGRGGRRARRRAGRPGVHRPAARPARPAGAGRLAAPGPGPGARRRSARRPVASLVRANGPFARTRPGSSDARGAGAAASVGGMSETSVVWFRRDLRVRDQPIVPGRRRAAPRALALFVLDPALLDPAGPARRTFLYRSLRDLDASAGREAAGGAGGPGRRGAPDRGRGRRRHGARGRRLRPVRAAGATRRWPRRLAADGRELVRTGSPYAVAPGRVRKADGDPFRVFTPFRRAWAEHGWRKPADTDASTVSWLDPEQKRRRPAGGADPRRRGGRRRPARRRRAGRARAVGGVPGRGGGRLRRGPEPPGQAGHLPDVGVPQVRGDPPADHARRPGLPAVRVGGHLPHRDRLARVLRRHPVPAPGLGPPQLRPGLRRAAAGRGRRGAAGRSTPGARAAPASRSSTPGCGSCASRPGCTTGSA